MSEWQEFKLGEVANIISEKTGISSATIENYISTDNMLNDFGGVVKAEKLPKVNKVNSFNKGDVLFSNIRTYFKKVWYSTFDGTVSADVLVFRRKDKKLIENRYLYYLLCNPDFTEYSVLTSKGAKMPRGDKDAISEYKLFLPPLPEQKAIASVLSSLDDKIDLLHRQNKTLEAMAETLFRHWFVESDNKNWDEELGNVIETTSGGTPSRSNMKFYENGVIDWVKSKELNGTFILDTEEKITEDAVKRSSAKILHKNSILIAMYGATVGEYGIISKEMTCNQAVCSLKPNEQYPYTFIFFLIKMSKEELKNMAIGSAQQNISQELIKKLPVPRPSEEIYRFNTLTEPYFEKIKNNIKQIRTLEKLRDNLLPKLMSGEVRVEI